MPPSFSALIIFVTGAQYLCSAQIHRKKLCFTTHPFLEMVFAAPASPMTAIWEQENVMAINLCGAVPVDIDCNKWCLVTWPCGIIYGASSPGLVSVKNIDEKLLLPVESCMHTGGVDMRHEKISSYIWPNYLPPARSAGINESLIVWQLPTTPSAHLPPRRGRSVDICRLVSVRARVVECVKRVCNKKHNMKISSSTFRPCFAPFTYEA